MLSIDLQEHLVTKRMITPSVNSSSPTPSTMSLASTNRWEKNMVQIRGTAREQDNYSKAGDALDTRSSFGIETVHEDSEDDELLSSSSNNDSNDVVGLFDVVKREFRVKTAVITNRPDYETPGKRRPKPSFIQDIKKGIGVAMEFKNRGSEEMQNKELKEAMKSFHLALLHLKGLDPDEGVTWSAEFENMDKDKLPLRVMPVELKEIKEGIEIDCYMGLAGCLQSKERVPYRRIKEYCMKILVVREDHVPALTRCGMACYYLREYEISRFYLQNAKDYSGSEGMDPQIRKYLNMVENQLGKATRQKK